MTRHKIARIKLLALGTAALLVLSAGPAIAFTANPAQVAGNQAPPDTGDGDAATTVTAEDIEAQEVQLENVVLTNLTIEIDELDLSQTGLQSIVVEAINETDDGLEVDSSDVGTVETASINIENGTATMTAEIDAVTLTGVSADSVTVNGSMMYTTIVRPMLNGGALSFESMTVQGLSIGTLTSGPVDAETPTEPETPTPGEAPPETPGPTEPVPGNDTDTDEASVTFDEQTSDGTVVTVASVTLPDGGYVAIHNDALLDGDAVGSVIGVSEYLEPGTAEDVSVTLFDVPGANLTETQLTESQLLIAMPHEETNDNTAYDFVATDGAADGPSISNGSAVTDAANVTVSETAGDGEGDNVTDGEEDNVTDGEEDNVTDGEGDNVTDGEGDNVTDGEGDNVTTTDDASVSFENQTSDGTTVNVANVTLPDGGYVAIHNDSLLDGDAVGSVVGVSEYLEPGTYENETVSLFNVSGANFTETQLNGSQTLIAMPHEETNENTTYDFVATDGAADGPSISNGTAVTDDATVTVEE
jgi:hypothetical protein